MTAARPSEFNLALIQMRVLPGEKTANLDHATALIERAAAEGAEVVVLPEAFTLGWTHPSARELADAIPSGDSCRALMAAAAAAGIYLCAGLIERDGPNIHNSAILVDPSGRLLLHHRKINELDIVEGLYARGDRLSVAETPWGRFGVMICADGFAPGQVISRSLGCMGARIILSPSSWAVPPDHDNAKTPYGKLWLDNYIPVARDFRLWIAGVSNVGPVVSGAWRGHRCIGCSLLIDPEGAPVLQGPYGDDAECILHASVRFPRHP